MPAPVNKLIAVCRYALYPVLIGIGFVVYACGLNSALTVGMSATVAVTVGAVLVTLMEYCLPHRKSWAPDLRAVANDFLFMGLVQILLPRILAFIVALLLVNFRDDAGASLLVEWWPTQLPFYAQAILMLFVADLLRYWLHRLAHEWPPLWRFHAVHHSPQKLYWFNVGRFHPVDKAVQFLCDALPFIVVGVSAETMSIYFVFYAINGFIQHANIDLRLGWLNYLISGPELHRWHHSVKPEESNTNYGNNLIVWDLVFGTRYLPAAESVGDLGLINSMYPSAFIQQMSTPFQRGLDKIDMPSLSYREMLRNACIAWSMYFSGKRLWRDLAQAAEHPHTSQLNTLREILACQSETAFARDHEFQDIHDYSDYKQRVTVHCYEDLRPAIEQQQCSSEKTLSAEMPYMYALTSGSTDKPKLIPVLEEALQREQRNQRIFAYLQYSQVPHAFSGKMFGLVGAPVEGHLDNGLPYGAVSGLFYQNMPKIMRDKYVIPAAVFSIKDHELKYLLCLRLAMAEKNLSYLGGANPSTFIKLQQLIQEHGQDLVDGIKNGNFHRGDELDKTAMAAVKPLLQADVQRADELQTLLDQSQCSIRELWPYIALLTTWTGGSCGIALTQLRNHLPESCQIMDLGYLASEMRGTLTLSLQSQAGMPLLCDNFYEFVPRDDWELGRDNFVLIDELIDGAEYYIFVTTRSGLYRYHMDDIVGVSGLYKQTPLIHFIQKGSGVCNITGEKLYESQVVQALERCCRERSIDIPFFLLLANQQDACYEIYVEQDSIDEKFVERLDLHLSDINIEYSEKRKSQRLSMMKLFAIKAGTAEAFKAFMVQAGQREGQYKPRLLHYKEDITFPIEDYCER